MQLNYDQLVKKIIDFWNKFDGKEFTSKDIRDYFDINEIKIMLTDEEFFIQYYIVQSVILKIIEKDDLLTQAEAESLIKYNYNSTELYKYLSDETLLKLIREDDIYITSFIAEALSTDESKMKAFDMVSDLDIKTEFVRNFSDDKLKIEYMKKISKESRSLVIASFKNDDLIEKYINALSNEKSSIISKLSNDEKKIYYLKKYFLLLDNYDKANIISSIKDDNLLMDCLLKCNDKIKAEVIRSKRLNKELMEKVLQTMTNKKELADILKYAIVSSKIVVKYIEKITNIEDFTEIVYKLDEIYQIKYLSNFNDKIKYKIINGMSNKKIKFDSLKYLNNKELIFEIIQHTEEFPEYSNEYDYLIEIYSEKYNIDKNRLIFAIQNTSYALLKSMDNPNIIKILMSSEEKFKKIIRLFNKEESKMNSSSINDFLNTILQRKFRIDNQDIILTFPSMLNAIDNNDKNYLITKLNEISKKININEILIKSNLTTEVFINQLLEKNQNAINNLHLITTKYVTITRNEYIRQNLEPSLEKCAIVKYDKKDLLKNLFMAYPIELVTKNIFNIDLEEYNRFNEEKLSSEEIEFLKNKELIKKIIEYKKNPSKYENIPEDVKQNIRFFNNLMEKLLKKYPASRFAGLEINRKIYEFEEVNAENLIDIMKNLNMDLMEKSILNNPEMYDMLMKFWNQYKMGSWGTSCKSILNDSGLMITEEVLANFIQYFEFSYETLKEKIEKGELANISLTALIDLAGCYSTESIKYSMIFGEENFRYISSNPGPNSASMLKEKRIEKALEHLKTIRTRKYVTVPPVDKNFDLKNGKKMNIVVGNFSNPINLTYGERTGACMRIGGAGESLFNACIEDDNFFHIRFTNPNNGKFVSRVSGFRNGNTVFLNELRYSEDPAYTNEDVVESCQMIAKELIELSKTSNYPIDNVVVTPYYSMEKSNLPYQNLKISNPQHGMRSFYTDVSTTSIVLATSDEKGKLVDIKLGIKDVPKYTVIRDKQKILYNVECQKYVAHLQSMDKFLSGISIDEIEEEINDELIFCYAGEDWCIMVDKDGKIEEYIMNNSINKEQALLEVEQARNYLNENLNNLVTISNNISMGM